MESKNTPYPFEIIQVNPIYPSNQVAREQMEMLRCELLKILRTDEE